MAQQACAELPECFQMRRRAKESRRQPELLPVDNKEDATKRGTAFGAQPAAEDRPDDREGRRGVATRENMREHRGRAPPSPEETAMLEGNKIAAALLACETSRQQQEMVKAGPGRPLESRDVAAELWAYFEGFLDRLERDHGSTD